MDPERIAKYTILRKIASGGMATVYLARDESIGRDVALKMIHPHLMGDAETVRRFENEARAVGAISHDNIVRLFDYGEDAGRRYLVMEYVEGATLSEIIAREKTIPNLALLEMALQILSGLRAAHEHGIFHRDVKPGNILIDKYGSVRLTDFGVAFLVNQESLTLTGALIGSPSYISPEQAETLPVTATSDVFSLGILLYECATGELPFVGKHPHATIRAILSHEPVPPHVRNPAVLAWVSDFVLRCLAKKSDQRPDPAACVGSIEAFRDDLGLTLGKNRVATFLGNPSVHVATEKDELFGKLTAKASDAFRQRNTARCVRLLDQARAFRPLRQQDLRLLAAIRRRAQARRTLLGALVLVAAIGAGYGLISLCAGPAASLLERSRTSRALAPAATPVGVVAAPQAPATQRDTVAPVRQADKSRPRAESSRPGSAVSVSGQKGFVSVRTNPPWVSVWIDDLEVGETPRKSVFAVTPGAHVVRLEKAGLVEWKDTVVVAPADTVQLTVRLLEAGELQDK